MKTDPPASNFDERAATYSNHRWHVRYAHRLVELSGVKKGDQVLDAATGTGLAAYAAASIVGPEGSVIGVDLSAEMLRQAELLADHSNRRCVRFIQADAAHLPDFETSTFDVVFCSAGLLYMSAERALREWHRVLRPHGVVAFSTMQIGSPPAARLFRECALELGLGLDDPSEGLGTIDRCREALHNAGFEVKSIEPETVKFTDDDFSHAWDANLRSAGHEKIRGLGADRLDEFRLRYEGRLSELASTDTSTYDANVLYAIGIR